MAIRPDWNIGKINLVAGSDEFTTVNAMLNMSAVEPGDVIITPSGHILVIKVITGANSGTLMLPCPAGAAGTELPLRIRFQPDGSRVAGALRAAAALLTGSNIEALAALIGQEGKIPIFTGAGTMALADASDFETDLSGIEDAIGALDLSVADLSSGLEASNVNVGLLFDGLNDAETAIDNRVRFDAEQNLTTEQSAQVLANIRAASSDQGHKADSAVQPDALNTALNEKFDNPTGDVSQFIQGNGGLQAIVGTVAQSGGAIVQMGSNANGEFVRFAGGLQICWGHVVTGTVTTNVVTQAPVVFPASFAVAPNGYSNSATSVPHQVSYALGSFTADGAIVYAVRSSGTAGINVQWLVFGRWF